MTSSPRKSIRKRARAPVTRKVMIRVREDYAAGKRVRDICAEHHINSTALTFCLEGGTPGPHQLPRIPRRYAGKASRVTRPALVRGLWRAAKGQVCQVQARLARTDQAPAERERDTRVLAVLVKTLRELAALDQTQPEKPAKDISPSDDDAEPPDAVPRDLDELRRELARRVDRLRQGGIAAGAVGGDDA